MAIYNKPDENVFASSARQGEVSNFPDIGRGWGVSFDQTGGIPPMEWFNFLFKRTDEKFGYLFQRGLSEWSATQEYPIGALVQYKNLTYKAKRANTNKNPEQVESLDWQRWGFTQSELKSATLTESGITQLLTSINSNDETKSATPKSVKMAYDKGVEANNNADGRVSKSGDTMTGALNLKYGDYSYINQFNSSDKYSRIETTPDNQSNFYKISYWSADTELHSALLPKRGVWKVIAYEDWVNDRYVPRTGDTIINGHPTFINNGGFITINSTGVNWAAIDYKMWNSTVPLVTTQAEDLGNYSGAFNIFTTPEGQDYNTDRREKTAQIHHNGRIWSKHYGWLDEQFAIANNTHKKSRCHNHWFPSHYAGAEVVDLPVNDVGGIRITWMQVKLTNYLPPYVDIYLPMEYSGFAKATVSDDGGATFSYGTEMIGNNIVRVYCKQSGAIGFNLHVIGWANF